MSSLPCIRVPFPDCPLVGVWIYPMHPESDTIDKALRDDFRIHVSVREQDFIQCDKISFHVEFIEPGTFTVRRKFHWEPTEMSFGVTQGVMKAIPAMVGVQVVFTVLGYRKDNPTEARHFAYFSPGLVTIPPEQAHP